MTEEQECLWPGNDKLMQHYHQTEWGFPLHDDQKLFEFLVLDAFQAGLSWKTILYKRENLRIAFDQFDALKIALYDEEKILSLVEDASIIRNRAKIRATVTNAQSFLKTRDEFGSFDHYIWQFTDGKILDHFPESLAQIPSRIPQSDAMSRDLQKRGFKFVGSTICYAFMQAAGMINDHLRNCPVRKEIDLH